MKNRIAATLGASAFLVGVGSTVLLYENVRVKRYEQDVAIMKERYNLKMKEMEKQRDELTQIVNRYQQEELKQKKILEHKLKKYPILKYGLPGELDRDIFYYDSYISKIDQSRKVPKWVANSLSLSKESGLISRESSTFGHDPNDGIPMEFKPSNSDYWHSGYDRGHMIPAGDMRNKSQKAMDETFYLLQNIVPQDSRNNRGYWRRLEHFVRALPKEYKQVHVVSGPLYLATDHDKILNRGKDEFGNPSPSKRILSHAVIGDNQISVPTHLFKVILAEMETQDMKPGQTKPLVMSAFLLPNAHIPPDTELSKFEVPVKELEKKVGFHFFQKARIPDPGSNQNGLLELMSLCAHSRTQCKMEPEDLSFEFIYEINQSKSIDELNQVWQSMLKQGTKPHAWTKEAYDKKLEFLMALEKRKANAN